MRTILAAAGLCAALCATPAIAQDAGTPSSGFYTGPIVGIDDLESDRAGGGGYGFVYGGVVGYDFSTPTSVFGLEAELTDSNANNNASGLLTLADKARLSNGLDLYAGVRAGFRPGRSNLIYAKAGYTNLDVKGTYTSAAGTTTSVKDTLDGVRVGIGVEFGLTSNVALRTEYRYSWYGSFDNVGSPNLNYDMDRQQGTASLLFRF